MKISFYNIMQIIHNCNFVPCMFCVFVCLLFVHNMHSTILYEFTKNQKMPINFIANEVVLEKKIHSNEFHV